MQVVFHCQLDGQSVGIPAGFTVDQIPLLGFKAAENILDGTGHHMVNARFAVGRWRPFIKDKRGFTLPGIQRFLKDPFLFP